MTIAASACPICATASKILTYQVQRPFAARPLLAPREASKDYYKPGDTVLDSTLHPTEIAARLADGSIVQV